MRALYLVRHGLPDFPNNERLCIGKYDIGLSSEGLKSAEDIGTYFNSLPFEHLLVSPLLRTRQSAEKISKEKIYLKDFEEASMGDWEGLSFKAIKSTWSDYYRQRGDDIYNISPPRGESFKSCQDRVRKAFDAFVNDNPTGDIVIVAHSGVCKMLMTSLTDNNPVSAIETPMPYGGMMQILLAEEGAYLGVMGLPYELPNPIPTEEECLKLLDEYGTPDNVINHCKAVCKKALEITDKLSAKGYLLDRNLIKASALLHDIAKTKKKHGLEGALYLLQKGYPSVAAIVGDHMTLLDKSEERVSEKTVVCLADKLIKDTNEVTLEERFFSFVPEEKRPFIIKKYEQAKRLKNMFEV